MRLTMLPDMRDCDMQRFDPRVSDCASAGMRYCSTCSSNARDKLVTLAHNLQIGAALCEAHALALDEAEGHRLYHEHGYRRDECWSPGCQRRA